jgi:hypothetical protein
MIRTVGGKEGSRDLGLAAHLDILHAHGTKLNRTGCHEARI